MTSGRRLFLGAACLLIGACSGPERTKDGIATDDGIAKIGLPEEQFQALLSQSVLTSQTGAMHLYALGLDRGCEVLDDAVDETVERNLPKWRTNLVAAYRGAVPADRLAKAVDTSPRDAHSMLKDDLPAIASAMQQSSEPLLGTASVEVLSKLAEAASAVDRASIDTAARQQELAAAKATGRICGIAPLGSGA